MLTYQGRSYLISSHLVSLGKDRFAETGGNRGTLSVKLQRNCFIDMVSTLNRYSSHKKSTDKRKNIFVFLNGIVIKLNSQTCDGFSPWKNIYYLSMKKHFT